MNIHDALTERERTMSQEECQAALIVARQENAELQDKYLRAAAAIDNTRKQAERDAATRLNQRLRSFFTRLLEVADDLERVLAYTWEDDTLRPGVEAALQRLQRVMGQEGVTSIAVSVGTPFDPQIHEAMTTQEGDVDRATVAEILQRGYLFDGQVLRPARVVVTVPARGGG